MDKKDKVEAEIARLLDVAVHGDILTDAREEARDSLRAADSVLSFNEWTREKANPDNALEDMDYLDEMAGWGGDWGKPSFVLARAFYGYRFNPYRDENAEREAFNPNDEYFTFNGYGNLVSVREWDWAAYWATNLDAASYVAFADDESRLDEIADALGIEDEE